MKIIILFTVLVITLGCSQEQKPSEADRKAKLDSFSLARYGKTSDERVKEMTNQSLSNALMDTIGLSKAPIKVLKATLFKKEYSNYRDIRLTYKNVSTKRVDGIKFRWKGVNAFGEPADMGNSMVEGFGGGFTDEPLKPGRTEISEWSILSRDGKKVVLAWPIEVAFSDGTKWTLNK